ncbi:MAG: dienelactone hydrolase family protein [Myxococcota bacterium]|nr:dienelactone hydrolase family protein [Myxococcota bacterium]
MHISDFHSFPSTHYGIQRTVYSKGEGPSVIILPEIPGLHTATFTLGRRIAEAGFRVYLLSLFGKDNQPFRYRDSLKQILRVCINKEFAVLAGRRSSPIVDWIRSFCRNLDAQDSEKGIGLIGMCLTGNFALGLLAEPWMLAPILSQPSLPFVRSTALHVSPETLQRAKERKTLQILGLRFSHDVLCPRQRFSRLKEEFPHQFESVEIDSSLGNPHHIPLSAHSVLTKDLVDTDGHPTQKALDKTLQFLQHRLKRT